MSTPSAAVLRKRLSGRAKVRQIEVFAAIAELGTVRQAALRLGLSQPGVTKHLHDLESLLDSACGRSGRRRLPRSSGCHRPSSPMPTPASRRSLRV